jgi:hypothetical protein
MSPLPQAFWRRQLWFAVFLVVLTGLVEAFFIGKTAVDRGQAQYTLDFGKFPWVEPPHPSPAGYFRETLYISEIVERGWIQVAATDHFLVYVNGTLVNESYFGAARVTGIFDIRSQLVQGKNVIAIYVPRVFAPGSSQLRVRGAYAVAGSHDIEFGTSNLWRASNTPDNIINSYQWYDTALDDTNWAFARAVAPPAGMSTVQAVTVPPRLYSRDPAAQWIGSSDAAAQEASFAGSFHLPGRLGESWLQIAATGSYDVFINGYYVIAQPSAQLTSLPFAQETIGGAAPANSNVLSNLSAEDLAAAHAALPLQVPTEPQVPSLLSYDVTRWCHPGENRVLIRVRADNQPALTLAELSTQLPQTGETRFNTDRTWRVVVGGRGVNAPVRELGADGAAPFGLLPQAFGGLTYTPAVDLVKYGPWALCLTLTVAAFLAAWLVSGWLFARLTGGSLVQALALDAVMHVPALAFLLICWLLTFDIRFNMDWCYRPVICAAAVGILFLGRLLVFLAGCLFKPDPANPHAGPPQRSLRARYLKLAAFATLVLVGFCLRAWDLNGMSMGSDEITMVMNADGVLKSGYPHSPRGSFDRLLATYELIPYSLAASSFFFGRTEFAYHLPALIFSTLTIGLIGFAGTRMFDWRVGLVSSLIYTFFPPSIAWARNAFYPSQEQFLSLLTFWSFYEAVRAGPFRSRYLTWAAIGFIFSYLSWEGSGFIVPALFVAVFALRWGDYSWITDWHLWRCFVVMTATVVSQLSYRQLTIDGYLGVGYSLSDITAPTDVYKDLLVYNPWYYLHVLFFPEVNFVLSLFLFLGFLFCWKHKAIRYVVVVLFTLELCYTNFLPFYAPRYCYNAETLVILSSVAIYYRFHDQIIHLGGHAVPAWFRGFRWFAGAALTAWLLLATNEYVVESYRLSPDAQNPALFARVGYYKTDHRAAAWFVKANLQPGDAVVAYMPHMFQFYTSRPADFSINTFLNEKMTYDGGGKSPYFIDKFLGMPMIRSLDELREVQTRYRRLWILVPIYDDTVSLTPDTLYYLTHQGKIAFESYREQVIMLQGVPRAPELAPQSTLRN